MPRQSGPGSNFRYKLLILHRIIAFPDSQNHFKTFQIISKSNNRAELARPFLSSATCDRIRSWLTAQGQILSSLGSSLAKNHDKEKDPGFIPATPPAHLPAIDLLADLNGSGQAKEFGLKFH